MKPLARRQFVHKGQVNTRRTAPLLAASCHPRFYSSKGLLQNFQDSHRCFCRGEHLLNFSERPTLAKSLGNSFANISPKFRLWHAYTLHCRRHLSLRVAISVYLFSYSLDFTTSETILPIKVGVKSGLFCIFFLIFSFP